MLTDSNALSNQLTPVERLYQEIRKPVPPKAAPHPPAVAPPLHLEWTDVDAILRHKREASPAELEYIIEHASEFHLKSWQRNQIGVKLSMAMVNRARPTFDAKTEFLYNTLHVAETPAGLLHNREWVQRELKAGAQAIANCRNHRPPRCACWRTERERLWRIQDTCGGGSPEAWATERLWATFEEMEYASQPERATGFGMASQPIPWEPE